jgi:biopolymer transport protein ExbB/TolQ
MKTLSESMQMYGGVFIWVQIFVMLLMVVMAVVKFRQYYGIQADLKSLPFHKSHHAILFLGVFNMVWGMFTQVLGFVQALNAIIAAADVSPALIMEGLKNSFICPLIGLVSLLVAALLWAVLQGRYSSRTG